MNWLFELYRTHPIAQAIALIALVCTAGMALGSVKVRGIGLGTAAVLFVGIVVGYIGRPVDHEILEFVKELGLLLFVFCIGLQLGPGFFASLREVGVRLNILAASVVILGALLAAGLGWLMRIDNAAVLGIFSGATTNTPSLGAAQQALSELPGISAERAALPALGYAVSYPGAIVGIILTILFLKRLFRVDPSREAEALAAEKRTRIRPLASRAIVVGSLQLAEVPIGAVPGLRETGVIISRLRRKHEPQVHAATGSLALSPGDVVLAVGEEAQLDKFERIVGHRSDENLTVAAGGVTSRKLIVTSSHVLGKSLREIGMRESLGVNATRVTRAGIEMAAAADLRLQFGDTVQVVGDEQAIGKAIELLGDSLKALNETHFVPLFAGIVAGIALGTLPLAIPGLPQPLRLGLAGGPLIVAILVSRLGRIGPLVWHVPASANLAFREFGIALFFAAVGLLAGPGFFATVFSTSGLVWLAAGACVTVLPILLVGLFALGVWRLGFLTVSGLLAGSMTDPPALAFATNICGSETPTVAYATVYPLTTLMRILTAQVLAVALCG